MKRERLGGGVGWRGQAKSVLLPLSVSTTNRSRASCDMSVREEVTVRVWLFRDRDKWGTGIACSSSLHPLLFIKARRTRQFACVWEAEAQTHTCANKSSLLVPARRTLCIVLARSGTRSLSREPLSKQGAVPQLRASFTAVSSHPRLPLGNFARTLVWLRVREKPMTGQVSRECGVRKYQSKSKCASPISPHGTDLPNLGSRFR